MSYVDYDKAQKLGLKAFKNAVSKGESEYLPVLDEILEDVEIQSEVNLGLVQIPLDRIVGTSNFGRTYAFANNFMPILDYKTEFGSKWSELCDSQIEEGIREPIKAFEYLNRFYVIEGNKRVSVMKYFEAVSIPGVVTRKIPKLSDDPEIRIYYEFMDFYKLTEVNYIWFSETGCFNRILALTSEKPDEPWTGEQKKDFGSSHHRFSTSLKKQGGDKLPLTTGDAFLIFIDIYGYDVVTKMTQTEMEERVGALWDEFLMESKGREIQLRMEPEKQGRKKLMEYFWSPVPKKIMVAFIFDKDPKESEWLYAHELGRLYLDENCADWIKTIKVHNIQSEEAAVTAMQDLIYMGVQIIFTTTPRQLSASMKVAANNPDAIILNCSLNTSHKLIRTYYARLYEVKFLAGIIAGALSENGKIGYLADYPIVGMTANINAFALGAQMVNPNAKVYLEWTTIKGISRETVVEKYRERGVKFVSDQVMIKPNQADRQFGLYAIESEEMVNYAMPVYQWGAFYEKLIESVVRGNFKQEEENDSKAINYWWGLSAKVVDIICSNKVPRGVARLVHVIKHLMIKNEFSPFQGEVVSHTGVIKNTAGETMLPEDIMMMNWLVEGVVGEIPEIEELKEEAKSIVELKGISENDEDIVKTNDDLNNNI